MGQKTVSLKREPLVLVTGLEFCPYCLSTNIEETDTYTKCLDCGMGKNKSGKR